MQDTPRTPEKRHFVLRLIPPRSTFAQDMLDEEKRIMLQHVAYWKDLTEKGITIVYGPVLDPKVVWGLGVVEVESEEQARTITANDPAVKSGLNTLEIYPIRAVLGKR